MMKKLLSSILALLVIASSLVVTASAKSIDKTNTANDTKQAQIFLINNNIVNDLESKNIDVVVTKDNKIQLKSKNAQTISKANQILLSTTTSYPTPWVYMPANDVVSSKKLRAATRSAFSAVVSSWILGELGFDPKAIVAVAAVSFGNYWFNSVEEEDAYYFAKYYYRAIGPGKFDSNGNFIGDYQIRKDERLTKNSNNTGGQTSTTTKNSSIVDPWF